MSFNYQRVGIAEHECSHCSIYHLGKGDGHMFLSL